MKVVIATPLYPPELGGPATYSKLLEDGLPKHGIEVTLVKFGDVRHLPKFFRHGAYFFRVLKAARAADLVYALDAVSVGFPAMLAAKFARKPFAVKIVGDYAWEQGQQRFGVSATLDEFVGTQNVSLPLRIFRLIQTNVSKRAQRAVVPSEYLKGIVEAWGVDQAKVEVIYNSISTKELEEARKSLSEIIKLPKPLVLTVGRLVPWKNIEGIIQAIQQVRNEGLSVSLAVLGGGPKDRALMSFAFDVLPKESYVFAGSRSHEYVLANMAKADVFVLNSSYEGLSHVLIEASLLGVPIVATRVGGNPEVVVDGKNGLLVPVGDTKALAEAISRILRDPELRSQLGGNAKIAAERFSETKMLEETAACLHEIL